MLASFLLLLLLLITVVIMIDIKEPSVSTMLMNFENEFDPYGSMSVPLYQTATFKQVFSGPCST